MNKFQKFLIRFACLFYPVKIIGKENILKNETSLIVSNHLSAIDVLYISKCFLDVDVNFVAKKELFDKKLSSKILSVFGGIPIDRENPGVSSILKIIKSLKNGKNVVIFPEGTRNKTGVTKILPLKGGSGLFAVKAKKLLTPIIIYKRAKLFSKNYLIIGKPFSLEEYYENNISDNDILDMEKIILDKMVEVQEILHSYLGKKI